VKIKMSFMVKNYYFNKLPSSYEKTLSHLEILLRWYNIGFVYIETCLPIRYFCLNKKYDTLLICHDNDHDIGHINIELIAHHYKINVCVFDYCGYGLHSTKYLDEDEMYTDVKCVYEYLVSKKMVDPMKIIIYGHGLGSVPACYLASKLCELYAKKEKLYSVYTYAPKAVILVSPILSGMKSLLYFTIPICDLFRNDLLAPQINSPVIIIHETQNSTTSYSCSSKLASLFPNLNDIFTVENHDDYGQNNHSEFSDIIKNFLSAL
jgi:hypothetical protein